MPLRSGQLAACAVQNPEGSLAQRPSGRHLGAQLMTDGLEYHRHVLPVGADHNRRGVSCGARRGLPDRLLLTNGGHRKGRLDLDLRAHPSSVRPHSCQATFSRRAEHPGGPEAAYEPGQLSSLLLAARIQRAGLIVLAPLSLAAS
jgi:hypothetical protein